MEHCRWLVSYLDCCLLKPSYLQLQSTFFPGKELDGNEIEVTLAKPVDKDHRQAKAAAKAVMGATTYPSFTPYEYPSNTAAYGFPTYSSQYFMYGAPMTTGMGWEFKDKFLFMFASALF